MRTVAEKPHDAVVKLDTYRNLQRHRAVLRASAWHLVRQRPKLIIENALSPEVLAENGFWHEIATEGHSRSFIRQSITGRQGVAYCHVMAGLISEVTDKNCRCRQTHCHLTQNRLGISEYTLYFQKLESFVYNFVADSMGFSSFNFVGQKTHLFWHDTSVWRTDGRTDRRAESIITNRPTALCIAISKLSRRAATTNNYCAFVAFVDLLVLTITSWLSVV